jgi:hypothetical protein
MLLFGISGSINHGKSTLSGALTSLIPKNSRHFTSFQLVATVADEMNKTTHTIPDKDDIKAINEWLEPLPEILNQVVHVHCKFSQISFTKEDIIESPASYAKLFTYLDELKANPSLLRNKINESNVELYRSFLQWLGGYLVSHVSNGIWYEELVRRANQVKEEGAELCIIDGLRFLNDVKLVRDAGGIILFITRPDVMPRDTDEPMEREAMSIQPDILIINDGTIDGLKKSAIRILNDVKANNYQKSYQTSTLL